MRDDGGISNRNNDLLEDDMPKSPPEARAILTERRQRVHAFIQSINTPFTCSDICEATGMRMHNVRAAVRALSEGGAVRRCGVVKTSTTNGGTNDSMLFELTGNEYSEQLATKVHKEQSQRGCPQELPGTVIAQPIPGVPGGRVIRFGRDYPIGSGQSTVVQLTAGSILNAL